MKASENNAVKNEAYLSIPILAESDVLVAEGTIAGCVTAFLHAQKKRNVVLCASGTSLPFEVAACRRAWVTENELCHLPDKLQDIFRYCITGKNYLLMEKEEHFNHSRRDLPFEIRYPKMGDNENSEYYLNAHKLAICMEDILIESGVTILYGLSPCGVEKSGKDIISAVSFAGKSGLQNIKSNLIIDCTPTAAIAQLSGEKTALRYKNNPIRVSFSGRVRIDRPRSIMPIRVNGKKQEIPEEDFPLCLPDTLSYKISNADFLENNSIKIHGSLAEFILKIKVHTETPLCLSEIFNSSHTMVKKALFLLNKKLKKEGKARVLFYHVPDNIIFNTPFLRIKSASRNKSWNTSSSQMEKLCQPGPWKNLRICSAAVDINNSTAETLANPYKCVQLANILAKSNFTNYKKISKIKNYVFHSYKLKNKVQKLCFKTNETIQLYGTGKKCKLVIDSLPVIENCDVLIAGGGSSGVPAAISAASEGAKVTLLEKHFGLGGTYTIGGVGNYWFGRITEFLKKLDSRYDKIMAETGFSKCMAMRELLIQNGVNVITGYSAVGSIISGNKVTGIAVATPSGIVAVKAKVVIDATGDGDIAAWAGADYEYGNGRDAITLWGSFGSWHKNRLNVSRHYESCVDTREAFDLTREIIASRRRIGLWSKASGALPEIPQHDYTPRESRRITGLKRTSYSGILTGEKFEDLVMLARGNFDIKGIATSEMIKCGYIWSWNALTNFTTAIPYEALIPRDLENIMVIGRAYSATHDAMCQSRLIRDMITMGGVAGIAAVMAVNAGENISSIDVNKLQLRLCKYGILKRADLDIWAKPDTELNEKQINAKLNKIHKKKIKQEDMWEIISCGKKVIPALTKAFRKERITENKIELGRALCYLKDNTAVDFFIRKIKEEIKNGLPSQKIKTLAVPPEHGWAADPIYLLHSIAHCGASRKLAGILNTLAEKVDDNINNYANKISEFEYVNAICLIAEKAATKQMLPALNKLLKKSCFDNNLLMNVKEDPRKSTDLAGMRCAYLRLSIARALARCGSDKGYGILIDFLVDMRGVFARSAYDELVELTGKDYGNNCKQWYKWLVKNRLSLQQIPYLKEIP